MCAQSGPPFFHTRVGSMRLVVYTLHHTQGALCASLCTLSHTQEGSMRFMVHSPHIPRKHYAPHGPPLLSWGSTMRLMVPLLSWREHYAPHS